MHVHEAKSHQLHLVKLCCCDFVLFQIFKLCAYVCVPDAQHAWPLDSFRLSVLAFILLRQGLSCFCCPFVAYPTASVQLALVESQLCATAADFFGLFASLFNSGFMDQTHVVRHVELELSPAEPSFQAMLLLLRQIRTV